MYDLLHRCLDYVLRCFGMKLLCTCVCWSSQDCDTAKWCEFVDGSVASSAGYEHVGCANNKGSDSAFGDSVGNAYNDDPWTSARLREGRDLGVQSATQH